ncbi:hypothetical protein BKA70DRAFT_1337761 [Coprinopsis sp. MPI-PUGE-AT-0042]|nr:hypothetical protein BKA70DRAFT_1337761 [Coprinopsis sp. MPI-PUGE-AT-0042]
MASTTTNPPVSPPRRTLKRSASTASLASLPTPPRTYRRRGRGRSRGSCDSDSDSDDAGRRRHTPDLPTEDEGERAAARGGPTKKKRRVALAQDKDDEEAFWLGGSSSRHNDEEQEQDSDRAHSDEEQDGGKSSNKLTAATLKRQAPLLYRKLQASASSTTSSQPEQGLLSPPASHRKPTAVTTLEVASKTTLSTIEELPVTPRKVKTKKGLASPPVLKSFVDSPSNPFLETPVDPSLVLSSDSEGEDAAAEEKEVPEYDKPTVTYVFRGVKRVYQNPMYDHTKGRPVTPPPNSKLPVTNPLFSPDPTCKPRLLFPEAHKKRNKVKAAKAAAGGKTKKKPVVVESDSDDAGRGESSLKIPQPKFVPKAKAKKVTAPVVEDDPFA